MEQKIMKLLLIQLKLMALACVAAMAFFLFVAFSPVKNVDSTCKKSACIKQQQMNDEVRESSFFGKLFAYSNFGTN